MPEQVRSIPSRLIAGSDLTLTGHQGLSASQAVLLTGRPDLRQQILDAKPKLDPYTSFLVAVSMNDATKVRACLRAHPEYAGTRLAIGSTALHVAAVWNACSAASALLSIGADIEARDFHGETPLQWCTHSHVGGAPNSAMAVFLLKHHADPNTQDAAGNSPLLSAIAACNVPVAESLLASGADPNIRNGNGETCLYVLVQQGNQDLMTPLVSQLVSHGADRYAVCWSEQYNQPSKSAMQTPLEAAVSRGYQQYAIALTNQRSGLNGASQAGNAP